MLSKAISPSYSLGLRSLVDVDRSRRGLVAPDYSEAIKLEDCTQEGTKILYIWDGLQHVLKVLYGSNPGSVSLPLDPKLILSFPLCWHLRKTLGTEDIAHENEWDVACYQRTLQSRVRGVRKPARKETKRK